MLHRTLLLSILVLALPLMAALQLPRPLPGWGDLLLSASLVALLVGSGGRVWRFTSSLQLAGSVPVLIRARLSGPLLLVVRVQLVATACGVGLDLARVLSAQLTGLAAPDGSVLSGGMLLVTLACSGLLQLPDGSSRLSS